MATEAERKALWESTRNTGPVATFRATVPATAAGSDADIVLGTVPVGGVVTSVTYAPVAAITGADTNTRKLTVTNRGDDGDGTTEVASLQFDEGTDAADFVATAITLSGTAANLEVAAGDVLSLASDKVGTGIADPGGQVVVTVERG